MDNKLVTGKFSAQNKLTVYSYSWVMKEGNELHGTEHFQLWTVMISTDKLDDHAI